VQERFLVMQSATDRATPCDGRRFGVAVSRVALLNPTGQPVSSAAVFESMASRSSAANASCNQLARRRDRTVEVNLVTRSVSSGQPAVGAQKLKIQRLAEGGVVVTAAVASEE